MKKLTKENQKLVADTVEKQVAGEKKKLNKQVEDVNVALEEHSQQINNKVKEYEANIEEEKESLLQRLLHKIGKEDITIRVKDDHVLKIGKRYCFLFEGADKKSVKVTGQVHLFDNDFVMLKDPSPSLAYTLIAKKRIISASIESIGG